MSLELIHHFTGCTYVLSKFHSCTYGHVTDATFRRLPRATVRAMATARAMTSITMTTTRMNTVHPATEYHEQAIRDWYSASENHLPPGLAKKDRLPPGLEKPRMRNPKSLIWPNSVIRHRPVGAGGI